MAPSLVGSPVVANSLSVTIPATTAGNCLVVAVGAYGTGAMSITGMTLGGAAGNFAELTSDQNPSGSERLSAFIWACPDCAGGQTAVAVTASGLNVSASFGAVTVYEVAGLAATIAAVTDQVSHSQGSAAAWTSLATATTTHADEFWVGVADTYNAATGPASPWTNNGQTYGISGYQIATATGAATYSGTQTAAIWAAAVAALAPAPAGTDTSPAYATSASDLGSSWVNPTNAEALDASYATFTAP